MLTRQAKKTCSQVSRRLIHKARDRTLFVVQVFASQACTTKKYASGVNQFIQARPRIVPSSHGAIELLIAYASEHGVRQARKLMPDRTPKLIIDPRLAAPGL
jgi:hypothetical protein